jgi:hypothetical protein
MQFAVFGGIDCPSNDPGNECATCNLSASGLQPTFMLYKNAYSQESAMDWEE